MDQIITHPLDTPLAERIAAHRPMLVRWCAHLSGDHDAAEDLAQETLIEALRGVTALRDEAALTAWLRGIARNVCLRWQRRRGRDRFTLSLDHATSDDRVPTPTIADDIDLEVELERGELATLLDRALALLPPDTRAVLVQKYVEEQPSAVIAARLGLSEGAVALRLHRGKLALGRVLATDLRHEAASFGIVQMAAWQDTRIWCPRCGQRRLHGLLDRTTGEFALRCAGCCPEPDTYITRVQMPEIVLTVKGYRTAFRLVSARLEPYFSAAARAGEARCLRCQQVRKVRYEMPPDLPPSVDRRGVYMRCERCGDIGYLTLADIAAKEPQGQQFWRDHGRIRARPDRLIEWNGRSALLLGVESITSAARLDVITTADTYEVLDVQRSNGS